MRQLILSLVLLAVASIASAYSIKHSYSAANNSTEYYGACEDGQMIRIIEHADGSYSYEGPAGSGRIAGEGGLDRAAAEACGEG